MQISDSLVFSLPAALRPLRLSCNATLPLATAARPATVLGTPTPASIFISANTSDHSEISLEISLWPGAAKQGETGGCLCETRRMLYYKCAQRLWIF